MPALNITRTTHPFDRLNPRFYRDFQVRKEGNFSECASPCTALRTDTTKVTISQSNQWLTGLLPAVALHFGGALYEQPRPSSGSSSSLMKP